MNLVQNFVFKFEQFEKKHKKDALETQESKLKQEENTLYLRVLV